MKSAYELAMERLQKEDAGEALVLTDEQKEELAAIDGRYKSKIAEREIFLNRQRDEALKTGDRSETEKIERQIRTERERLEDEREQEKEKVRARARVEKID